MFNLQSLVPQIQLKMIDDQIGGLTLKKSQSEWIHGSEIQFRGERRLSYKSQKELEQITRSFVLVNIINMDMNPKEADLLLQGMDLSDDKNILLTKVVNHMLSHQDQQQYPDQLSGFDGIHNTLRQKLQNFGNFKNDMSINEFDIEIKKQSAQRDLNCLICLSKVLPNQNVYNMYCGHLYCNDCMREYLIQKVMIADVIDIKCPSDGCLTVLQDKFIFKHLDGLNYQKYKKFHRVKILSTDPFLRWCPTVGCDQYVRGVQDSKKVTCSCGTQICFLCSSIYHGVLSCGQSLDMGFQQAMKKYLIHICSKCNSPIQKSDGCNHMTCTQCQYQFCWICKRAYTQGHYNTWNYIHGCPGKQYSQISPYKYPRLWIYLGQPLSILAVFSIFLLLIYLLILTINYTWAIILYGIGLTGPTLLFLTFEKKTHLFRYQKRLKYLVYLILPVLSIYLNRITLYIYMFIIISVLITGLAGVSYFLYRKIKYR